MSLRQRLAIEISVLAALTAGFLLLFPERPTAVDLGLALAALAVITLNAGFTRNEVWSHPPAARKGRGWRAWAHILGVTAALGLLAFAAGGVLAYLGGGWGAVPERLLNWRIVPAFLLYLPWALLQQTLFQFYLLGRLRVLLPSASGAVLLTGAGYGLVHFPDPWTTVATILMGIFWTHQYHRHRALVPLSLSHAALGSAFYYWVYGRDLVAGWVPFL